MSIKQIYSLPAFCIFSIITLMLALNGCAAPIIGAATDERSFKEHFNDSQIEAAVKRKVVSVKTSKILDINVYSFYGHVYLIGEADQEMRTKAMQAAHKVDGVRSVTSYFFQPGTMTSKDLLTEARINEKLLFTADIPSAQVQADVWGGQAVLLGVLSSQELIDKVIATVTKVPGVVKVKSYLRLVPNAG